MSEGQGLRSRSELTQRVISALVMAVLAIAIAWYGGPVFGAVWLLLAAAVVHEWFHIVGVVRRMPMTVLVTIVLVACYVIMQYLGYWGSFLIVSALVLLAGGAVAMNSGGGSRRWAATGVLYAALLALCTIVVRGRSGGTEGFVAILFLFAVVWMTDIGAYFSGRTFGGPKFAPKISPKKTWSGVAGGLGAGVGCALAVVAGAGYRIGIAQVLIAMLLSISVVFGDLFESYLKRRFGVKDAGSLIPGHGGFMDRLDGYVVAVTLAAIIGIARGEWENAAAGLLK